ncbi:MAG: thioesterase family protein [Acidimicrobiia bacterium]
MPSQFETHDDQIDPTENARGPRDPNAHHGGPTTALAVAAIERAAGPEMQIARVTVELLRPVPLAPLRLVTEVVRPGRKVKLVEAQLFDAASGNEVFRVRSLTIRRASDPLPEGDHFEPTPPPPPGPDSARPRGHGGAWIDDDHIMFHNEGAEVRFVESAWDEPGPSVVWIRLLVPVLDNEPITPMQRVVAASDFSNGVSWALPVEDWIYINPDLTVHVAREPIGEWIGMRTRTQFGPHGMAFTDGELFDTTGRIGRANQSLIIEKR